MKEWNQVVKDREMKDGTKSKRYIMTFETDDFEVKKRVEKFYQDLMDDREQTEKE